MMEILIVASNPLILLSNNSNTQRGIYKTLATSKIKLFVTSVNKFQPLTNITKNSILDTARVLDPSLNACI